MVEYAVGSCSDEKLEIEAAVRKGHEDFFPRRLGIGSPRIRKEQILVVKVRV